MGMKDRFRADRDFIDGVLNDADDMVVALNDGDGAPYAFPVNFVLLGDALYIHTAFTGKKMDLIRKNPRAGFSAYADVRIIREKATTTCAGPGRRLSSRTRRKNAPRSMPSPCATNPCARAPPPIP